MQKARVKLSSTDAEKVDSVAEDVMETAKDYNAKVSGPVPLPTDVMEVPVMKTPDGEGKETWERWEMRVHKRLIDVSESERALRQIMRVHVPEGVSIEVEIME
ncbi:MAG: 30S ribosomal protein S10 [Candidatus Nanohaloarchaea archaeon]|nr:30S ribosomal protein S10 [Candidatus Nanohaloarchaea archaeon]